MNIKKIVIISSILAALYGIYYWGIPAEININRNIGYVESAVKNQTGLTLKIKRPKIKMGILPAIWIMGANVALFNSDGDCALEIDNPAIKINFLPLLRGKLSIGNLSADSIYSEFVYTKNGELKLGEYVLPQVQNNNIKLDFISTHIKIYDINLQDFKQNKHLKLVGQGLNQEFKYNKRIKLSTSAKLFVDSKSSNIFTDIDIKLPLNKITDNQFKINGKIDSLDLGVFSDYAKALPNSPIESLSGVINFDAETKKQENNDKNTSLSLTLDRPQIIHKEKERSIYCNDKLLLNANIYTTKNSLKIENTKVLSKGIDVLLNGEVTRINSSMPNVDMNIKINKSRTENFIPLMPGEEDLLYEVNFLALKKNPFYGDIKGELNVKGRADKPDIDGKILVTNGYLNAPLPHNTKLADIKLDFAGTKMYMDIKVPAPINQTVWVKGFSEIYERSADLDISSTENVDLKTAQIVLNPLHEILKFELGPDRKSVV